MFAKKIKALCSTILILFLCLLTISSFLNSSTLSSTLISDTRFQQPASQSGTGTFTSSHAIYSARGYSLYIPGMVTTSIYYKSDSSKDSAGIYRGSNGNRPFWSDLPAAKDGSGARFLVLTYDGNRREIWSSSYCYNIDGTWSWYNYKLLLNPANFDADNPVKGRSLLDNAFLEPDVDKTALKDWLAQGGGTAWINAIISVRHHPNSSSTPLHSDMYPNRLWADGSSNYNRPAQIYSTSAGIYANTNLDGLQQVIDNDFDNAYIFPPFEEFIITDPNKKKPAVTTQTIYNTTTDSAMVNGDITDLGIPNPTQHGHVWGTTLNPTLSNSKTTLGAVSAIGQYSSSITGLSSGTTYHVRAYITNDAGTAYGGDKTFTTTLSIPTSENFVPLKPLVLINDSKIATANNKPILNRDSFVKLTTDLRNTNYITLKSSKPGNKIFYNGSSSTDTITLTGPGADFHAYTNSTIKLSPEGDYDDSVNGNKIEVIATDDGNINAANVAKEYLNLNLNDINWYFDGELKIKAVRDLAWKKIYGTVWSLGTPSNSIPVSTYYDSSISENIPIKLGYAVNFSMNTVVVPKNQAKLQINVKFKDSLGNEITQLYDNTTKPIAIPLPAKYKSFTIDGSVAYDSKDYFSRNVKNISGNNNTWSWIYYLPAKLSYKDSWGNLKPLDTDKLTVNFDISIYKNGTKYFRYNDLAAQEHSWNGDVFTYNTQHSLLEDINSGTTH